MEKPQSEYISSVRVANNGVGIQDRFGNALEVWKTGLPGCVRGEFKRVALLHHETETRGFQLSYNTLCVVSAQGEGFVYDVPPGSEASVTLRTHIQIPHGSVPSFSLSNSSFMFRILLHGIIVGNYAGD